MSEKRTTLAEVYILRYNDIIIMQCILPDGRVCRLAKSNGLNVRRYGIDIRKSLYKAG